MWGKISLSNVNKQTRVYNKKIQKKTKKQLQRTSYKPGFKQSLLIAQLHLKLSKHVKPHFLWF